MADAMEDRRLDAGGAYTLLARSRVRIADGDGALGTRIAFDPGPETSDPSGRATWTAELPLTRSKKPMFEFACHEGNYSLTNSLTGARAAERRSPIPPK
jgi:hypothetical protein